MQVSRLSHWCVCLRRSLHNMAEVVVTAVVVEAVVRTPAAGATEVAARMAATAAAATAAVTAARTRVAEAMAAVAGMAAQAVRPRCGAGPARPEAPVGPEVGMPTVTAALTIRRKAGIRLDPVVKGPLAEPRPEDRAVSLRERAMRRRPMETSIRSAALMRLER